MGFLLFPHQAGPPQLPLAGTPCTPWEVTYTAPGWLWCSSDPFLLIPFWTPLHRQHTLQTSASSFWQNHLSFQTLLLHMWNEQSLKLALSVCSLISAVQSIKKLCVLRQYRELEGTGKLMLSNHQQKQSCKAAHSARKRAQSGCIGRLPPVFQAGFICITVHVALRLSEKQIKELLLTMHTMTLISKQIHESSKPTKQPPNPVLLLDTACHHASMAAAVSISLVNPCFHTVSDTALLVSLICPFYPASVEALPPRFQVLCCRVF